MLSTLAANAFAEPFGWPLSKRPHLSLLKQSDRRFGSFVLSMSTEHLLKIISNDEDLIEIESIQILKTVRNFSKVILCSNSYTII